MAVELAFSDEEMAVSDALGYPKAYAKLCRDRSVGPYSHGPPFTFTPYALQHNEGVREMEMEELFPIVNPKAKSTGKAKHFVSLLWKQLNHLGNAGFDPAVIRVDPYGNVVYLHADPASPLAWDIDHWFPCSRGGLSVPSNLRILQWQVRKRKHNKLEFLIPWWDLQLGITVNHFLSIFASSKSDFRQRAFSFLFSQGESEEVNDSQTVDSHNFPYHFIQLKDRVGLAPAAIVVSRRESYDASSAVDSNRQSRPILAGRRVRHSSSKENENPYQAIVMARDSLKQREEYSKMQTEMQKLDSEVRGLREKNEEEKHTIQELELALIKRRRRADKCRRLAEAQSSYKTMLEKMIREAMHQSVVYKEQVRLNQGASNALMARLEAQKAVSDASERELREKHKQRDELEMHTRHDARKRPRMALHKELRVFLEEEHKASQLNMSPRKIDKFEEHGKCITALEDEVATIERNPERLQIGEIGESSKIYTQSLVPREPDKEEDDESRQQRGKGNVEKWLQLLLEEGHQELDDENETSKTDESMRKLNAKYPSIKKKNLNHPLSEANIGGMEKSDEVKSRRSLEGGRERKEMVVGRSESARILRRIPSSPYIISGMRKGVDCMRKKPIVMSDDEGDEERATGNSFINSIKKAVKM